LRAFEEGRRIHVRWAAAPGAHFDWLGIFKPAEQELLAPVCDAGYCGNWRYLMYAYTHGTVEGSRSIGPGSHDGYLSWPLPHGNYEIRMFLDDGYRLLAVSKPFRIVKAD
jgi:hypothetical protein